MHRDAPAICRKIDAALDFMGDDEDQLRPYLMYQIEEILGGRERITMGDCSTSELMALLAVALPVFARRLAGSVVPPSSIPAKGGKLLRLILSDEDSGGASTGS